MKSIQNILLFVIVILLSGCTGNSSSKSDRAENNDKKESSINQDTVDRKKPPVYYNPFDPRYPGGGFFALVDGKYGSMNFSDGKWQGYRNNGIDVVIDLGMVQKITSVSCNFLRNHEGWIYLPQTFTVLTSNDLKEYTFQGEIERETAIIFMEPEVILVTIDGLNIEARYVRVKANSIGAAPEWNKPAKGRPTWLFIDEIIVK